MEIERKYLVSGIPDNIDSYPCRLIEQGYLNTSPVVRVRRDNNDYYLTYKGNGMMARGGISYYRRSQLIHCPFMVYKGCN